MKTGAEQLAEMAEPLQACGVAVVAKLSACVTALDSEDPGAAHKIAQLANAYSAVQRTIHEVYKKTGDEVPRSEAEVLAELVKWLEGKGMTVAPAKLKAVPK